MTTPKAEILYFTDPLHAACWATEPIIYRLKEMYRDQLKFTYVMCGLIPDLAATMGSHGPHASAHASETIEQLTPAEHYALLWRKLAAESEQPFDATYVHNFADDHWSSYPACEAVKAAFLQSDEIGERYLRRLRRAAFTERADISKAQVYYPLAAETEGLCVERLCASFVDGSAAKAFQADLEFSSQYVFQSFPAFLPQPYHKPYKSGGNLVPSAIINTRNFDTYHKHLNDLKLDLCEYAPSSPLKLLQNHGALSVREIAEARRESVDEIRTELEALARQGQVRPLPTTGGAMWEMTSRLNAEVSGGSADTLQAKSAMMRL